MYYTYSTCDTLVVKCQFELYPNLMSGRRNMISQDRVGRPELKDFLPIMLG